MVAVKEDRRVSTRVTGCGIKNGVQYSMHTHASVQPLFKMPKRAPVVSTCLCCKRTPDMSQLNTWLSQKEYSMSRMCASCQADTYAAIYCETCSTLTLFTERIEQDPSIFACKLCHAVADEYGNPKQTVHITKRCHCCNARFVIYYNPSGNADVRYGPPHCDKCEFRPEMTTTHCY